MGTPIIYQPQVAILAVRRHQEKRPVVLETAEGDAIVIRHMMYLSLSYDHRIVDGDFLGATFLSAVARELENFPVEPGILAPQTSRRIAPSAYYERIFVN